jgi:hypothetical protein
VVAPERAETGRLIDAAGNVRLGIFREPVRDINYRDYRLTNPFGRPVGRLKRHFGFNQFQFLGGLSEALVFGCAIADLKYAATAFVYCYEPTSRRFTEHSFKLPLGLGAHFDQTPEDGTASFRSGCNHMTMTGTANPRGRRLAVHLASGVAIDAVFSEDDPPMQPMYICTRAGVSGWVYARKTAGLSVSGSFDWHGRSYDLGAIGALGHHDWSAGYMRRHTFWNWACLAGRAADGRAIGLNVSSGVNETGFTENCFWIDGTLHKLDSIHFQYDHRDLMKPWRVTSFDGRLRLDFHPEGSHVERVNAWIVASNFNQLFGRYAGVLSTAAGERIPIDGMLGYIESHYAKW